MKTQSDSKKYEGQCKFCRQDFGKKQIITHLDNCPERKKSNQIKNLRLIVTAPQAKIFWLIVEVNNEAKLKDLDELIRKVWVECCGHLSLFGDYDNKIGMGRVIMETFVHGDSFGYTYDFGSSTELLIEAMGYSNYPLGVKKKIELVARNYLPSSNCEKCGKQATSICTYCQVILCDQCAEKYHNEEKNEDEHYLLSLANSPRSGVCGYEQNQPLDTLF